MYRPVNPMNQAILEKRHLTRIKEINAIIRKNKATYEDFENLADERIKAHYTKEEYKANFIDYWFDERSIVIYKLRMIRKGLAE